MKYEYKERVRESKSIDLHSRLMSQNMRQVTETREEINILFSIDVRINFEERAVELRK